ncbi:MAG TPA: hypothetical protein VF777_09385 [Phycisphaerales bacterium]
MRHFSLLAVGIVVLLSAVQPVRAQTYFGSDQMIIPTNAAAAGGRATVYPSTIAVTGGPAKIQDITVTLTNMQHLVPSDFNVLLVGPQGQKVLLMRGCGGNQAISLTTINFNQSATASLTSGGKILPGTYKPTQFGPAALPSPAPGLPYDTSLAVFTGTNANGAWTLYVWDSNNDAAGGAINGWQLSFTGQTQTSFTYQGVLEQDGAPVAGDANVRFTLHGGAVSSVVDQPLAGPIVESFTGIANGVFTTEIDFGAAILLPRELWLGIEVESPPGSGYSTVSPRTRLAIVPVAGRALTADTAINATTATTALSANTANTANSATTATTATTAATANSAPWSGITNVPLGVANPPRVFSFNNSSAAASYAGFFETSLDHTFQAFNFQAGLAVVDFSLSAYTNIGPSIYRFRFRIGNTLSAPVMFTFNESLEHSTISGSVVIPVPAGVQQCSIYITRTFGPGDFFVDTGDTASYTILNIRQ